MSKILLVSLILALIPISCAKKEEKKVVVLPPKIPIEEPVKPEPPVYRYTSFQLRDPFLPLVVTAPKGEVRPAGKVDLTAIEITALNLSGLIWDRSESLAMFHDGNNFGYIFKHGNLLADNGKVIKGISGCIKSNNLVVLTQDKTTVTFNLKTGEKESQVKGMQYQPEKEIKIQ